jgi:hypothetical protein
MVSCSYPANRRQPQVSRAYMASLWLDDERDPRDPRVQERFNAEPGMIWVKTAEAAISRLKAGGVRHISLDHDLGTTLTGLDVARWIELNALDCVLAPLTWDVHSVNGEGARAIRRVLERADRHWAHNESRGQPRRPGVSDSPSP